MTAYIVQFAIADLLVYLSSSLLMCHWLNFETIPVCLWAICGQQLLRTCLYCNVNISELYEKHAALSVVFSLPPPTPHTHTHTHTLCLTKPLVVTEIEMLTCGQMLAVYGGLFQKHQNFVCPHFTNHSCWKFGNVNELILIFRAHCEFTLFCAASKKKAGHLILAHNVSKMLTDFQNSFTIELGSGCITHFSL